MTAHLQLFMILGAVVLLLIIFALLKRGLMSVKYSLLWLLLAVGLVIAAAFPYVVYVLRDLLDIEMPVNLVFLLMFCFVLVVLLPPAALFAAMPEAHLRGIFSFAKEKQKNDSGYRTCFCMHISTGLGLLHPVL